MKHADLIKQMTLEEKASLMSGANFWNTKGVERLGVPGMMLTDGEILELEQQCAYAADNYGCGIYVVTLDDFSYYDPDPLLAAEEIYRSMEFGVGENKNGILLMLSMTERDFAMVAYGDIANSKTKR